MEAKSREKQQCKVRKRGTSSSSSSSLVQKYRFKKAILVGKRGGSTTPVPTWMKSTKSPTLAESTKCTPPQNGGKAKELSVSARKLAATLWEVNQIPSPRVKRDLEDKKEFRSSKERGARFPHLSDPSYTPFSERMERSRGHGHRRRTSVVTKKLQLTDYNPGGLDSASNASLMEIENHHKGRSHTECIIGIKTRLKDVSNGLATSKELLKILNHICGLDEQNSSGLSLVSALRIELDRARIQVNQLIKEQRSNRSEIEYLIKRFEEEKAAWKRKECDRIRNAIACIAEELEVQKKLRRQTERLNKKLGKELAETKESLSKAMKELESEKRAKGILEQVYDELARGIGEDRAEVEEMKKESAKVREEAEKEREMLQLADVLREERVQMKLSDAKYQFEEKNAAVERLKKELETYLREKVGETNGEGSPNYERIKELEAYLHQIKFGSCQKADRDEKEGAIIGNGEVQDEDDSADSDLHSIELNMDNNSKSYNWSYVSEGNALDNPRLFSGVKDFKGRKSISDSIHWGSISLQRRNPNGIDTADCDLITEYHASSNMVGKERLSELGLHYQLQDHEDEVKKYRSVKTLKDHILSGSKRSAQNFASPTRVWGHPFHYQESSSIASDSSPVIQGDNLKLRTGATRGDRRTSTSSRQ